MKREKLDRNRFLVGGVDRNGSVDKITIQNAVETPFWMAVWAAEPERLIDVRMSYGDLKIICDLIDIERNRRQANRMSDDLISREAVIEVVDRHTRDDGTLDDDISVILEEIKTAFDKEKVMKQFQEVADLSVEDGLWRIELQKAFAIVKKGGIE